MNTRLILALVLSTLLIGSLDAQSETDIEATGEINQRDRFLDYVFKETTSGKAVGGNTYILYYQGVVAVDLRTDEAPGPNVIEFRVADFRGDLHLTGEFDAGDGLELHLKEAASIGKRKAFPTFKDEKMKTWCKDSLFDHVFEGSDTFKDGIGLTTGKSKVVYATTRLKQEPASEEVIARADEFCGTLRAALYAGLEIRYREITERDSQQDDTVPVTREEFIDFALTQSSKMKTSKRKKLTSYSGVFPTNFKQESGSDEPNTIAYTLTVKITDESVTPETEKFSSLAIQLISEAEIISPISLYETAQAGCMDTGFDEMFTEPSDSFYDQLNVTPGFPVYGYVGTYRRTATEDKSYLNWYARITGKSPTEEQLARAEAGCEALRNELYRATAKHRLGKNGPES